MIAPNLILYLMGAAVPIGFILGILVRRKMTLRGQDKPSAFLVVVAGTAITVVTVALITIAVTQIYGAITYPKFDATIVDVQSTTREVEDDDGNTEMRTYHRATYQFTDANGDVITKQSDQSGTSSIREGAVIRIAYKDGTMIELNVWGYVLLAIFVLVALISFWLWHMMMSMLWQRSPLGKVT